MSELDDFVERMCDPEKKDAGVPGAFIDKIEKIEKKTGITKFEESLTKAERLLHNALQPENIFELKNNLDAIGKAIDDVTKAMNNVNTAEFYRSIYAGFLRSKYNSLAHRYYTLIKTFNELTPIVNSQGFSKTLEAIEPVKDHIAEIYKILEAPHPHQAMLTVRFEVGCEEVTTETLFQKLIEHSKLDVDKSVASELLFHIENTIAAAEFLAWVYDGDKMSVDKRAITMWTYLLATPKDGVETLFSEVFGVTIEEFNELVKKKK